MNSYNNSTLVGNWFEDRFIEADRAPIRTEKQRINASSDNTAKIGSGAFEDGTFVTTAQQFHGTKPVPLTNRDVSMIQPSTLKYAFRPQAVPVLPFDNHSSLEAKQNSGPLLHRTLNMQPSVIGDGAAQESFTRPSRTSQSAAQDGQKGRRRSSITQLNLTNTDVPADAVPVVASTADLFFSSTSHNAHGGVYGTLHSSRADDLGFGTVSLPVSCLAGTRKVNCSSLESVGVAAAAGEAAESKQQTERQADARFSIEHRTHKLIRGEPSGLREEDLQNTVRRHRVKDVSTKVGFVGEVCYHGAGVDPKRDTLLQRSWVCNDGMSNTLHNMKVNGRDMKTVSVDAVGCDDAGRVLRAKGHFGKINDALRDTDGVWKV